MIYDSIEAYEITTVLHSIKLGGQPKSPPGIFAAPALKDTGGSIKDDHRKPPTRYSLTPLSGMFYHSFLPTTLVKIDT